MPKFCLIFICSILIACRPAKSATEKAVSLLGECPGDGHCSVLTHPGKALQINNDEYGNLHYGLVDKEGRTVYIVTYDRKVPQGVQDGTYREEVIFELPAKTQNAVFEGAALQNANLLFGRFCFCKGQTGYYRINEGSLQMSGKSKQRTIQLEFKVSQTPQVLSLLQLRTGHQ